MNASPCYVIRTLPLFLMLVYIMVTMHKVIVLKKNYFLPSLNKRFTREGNTHTDKKTGNVLITWYWEALANYGCRGKALSSTCVCAPRGHVVGYVGGWRGAWACTRAYTHVVLLIQNVRRVRHIVTQFMTSQASPYFSTLSHKQHDFRKMLLNIKCAFWFSLQTLSKHFSF